MFTYTSVVLLLCVLIKVRCMNTDVTRKKFEMSRLPEVIKEINKG